MSLPIFCLFIGYILFIKCVFNVFLKSLFVKQFVLLLLEIVHMLLLFVWFDEILLAWLYLVVVDVFFTAEHLILVRDHLLRGLTYFVLYLVEENRFADLYFDFA